MGWLMNALHILKCLSSKFVSFLSSLYMYWKRRGGNHEVLGSTCFDCWIHYTILKCWVQNLIFVEFWSSLYMYICSSVLKMSRWEPWGLRCSMFDCWMHYRFWNVALLNFQVLCTYISIFLCWKCRGGILGSNSSRDKKHYLISSHML